MQIKARSTIVMLCTVVTFGVMPMVWTGCASSRTKESTGEYIDNSSITAKVKASLAKDPLVSAFAVNVESFKGVVQLSGFVNTQEAKDRAEQVARGVYGVKSVTNSLIVKPN